MLCKILSSTFIDEVGYLPNDQHGADLLFQVISQRYERGSIIVTGVTFELSKLLSATLPLVTRMFLLGQSGMHHRCEGRLKPSPY
jgi:DNA replication protein DnaC